MATMRIAALDLGSNSFHLIVADATGDGTLVGVLREKEMLRLGDVVAREGRITGKAEEAALATLRRFKALADTAGAREIVACATSAIREAANRDELVERIANETGIAVQVISGDTEARLIFSAVRASVLLEPAPALCLDLGGGSLEVTVGDVNGLRYAASVPLGVARLTAQVVRDDPPSRRDLRRLGERIDEVLEPVVVAVAGHEPKLLVGTSGTLTDLAAAAVNRRTGALPPSLNQLEVSRDELEDLHGALVTSTTAQRQRITGMDARRAPVVVAGSVLILRAMTAFRLDRMRIGTWALREGMLLEAAEHHRPSDPSDDPRALRRTSVLDLCRRCGWPAEHSRQVARLSLTLFDATTELHGLGHGERALLEYGALLHDVGEMVSAEDHAKHSAYLIEHGRLRGFDPGEVATLACLGRYHRKGDPKEAFAPYALLAAHRRELLAPLVALLQVAHGLDHGRTGAVTDLAVDVDSERVRLRVTAASDAQLELWGASQSGKRFQRVLGRRLELVAGARATASSE